MIPRRAVTHPDAQLMTKAQAVKGRSLLADARRIGGRPTTAPVMREARIGLARTS
jgi:hypothetical protein